MTEKIATRDAYGQTLAELGKTNLDLVVLDADLSGSTRTAEFAKVFPERFFNMGIAEANMIATAAGLAAAGKLPFASTFAVFATGRAFDQVRNSVCIAQLNVKIAASHAGLTVGEDGASHQSVEDISLMRSLPGMTVIVPADAVETRLAVKAAAAHKGPVYLRLGRPKVPVILSRDYQFSIGKAALLRDGNDVTVVACGYMVGVALEAAQLLEQEGIEARVLNMSTIKPIDRYALVTAAQETGAIVTAEEHSIIGGLGSAVAEVIAEEYPVPVHRVGIKDTFGESGAPGELLQKYGLTVEEIVAQAKNAMAKKSNK
ncbi:MAG: transketolase family protein [bacterium]|jgi:transketolase